MSRAITLALLALTAVACAATVSATDAGSLDATTDGAVLDRLNIDADRRPPVVIPPPPRDRLAVAGTGRVVRRDGTSFVWGDYSYLFNGEPRDPAGGVWRPRASLYGGSRATLLSTRHFCALDESGTSGAVMRCWGENELGQLGDGTTTPATPGRPSQPATDVVDAANGGGNSWCALSTGGVTRCWGALAAAAGPVGPVPVTINTPVPLVRIFGSSSSPFYLGLDATGAAWCWGLTPGSVDPCLRSAVIPPPLVAVRIPDLRPVQSAAVLDGAVCALTFDQQVYCWGALPVGLVEGPDGGRSFVIRLTPTRISAFSGAVALSAGASAVFALMPTGRVLAAGSSTSWQTGVRQSAVVMPSEVPGVQDVIEIHASLAHTCALTASDEVYCWGGNSVHQLGYLAVGSSRPRPIPFP